MLDHGNHYLRCVLPVLTDQIHASEHDKLNPNDQPNIYPLSLSFNTWRNSNQTQTKVNKSDLLVTVLSFSGIILMIKPEFIFGSAQTMNIQTIYVLMSLACAFLISLISILIRKIKDNITNNVIVQYFYVSQIHTNALMLFTLETETRDILPWETKCSVLFIVLIVSGYAHQLLNTKALYFISASKSMPFRYVAVIIGFVIDILYYSVAFDWVSITGMVITCLSLGYLMVEKGGAV